ncbi:MAG: glycoside hydrolase family 18 protein [Bacillota bacterium]
MRFLSDAWRRTWPVIALAAVLFGVIAALPGLDPDGMMRLVPPIRKRLARPAFEVVGVYAPAPAIAEEAGSAGPGAAEAIAESPSYADLSDNPGLIDGIIGEWLTVNAAGRVTEAPDDGPAIGFARSSGVSVWTMATLRPAERGAGANAPARVPDYLQSAGTSRALASRLVAASVARMADGLVIDLTELPVRSPAAAQGIVTLVTEARRILGQGHALGVVIPSLTAPREQPYPVDPAALAANADWLVLQGWGEHWPSGTAGPLSGLEWLTDNLGALLARVSPGQVSLALPAFGYDWPAGGTGAVQRTGRDAATLRATPGVTAAEDPRSGETVLTYGGGTEGPRRLWYLDGTALASRVQLARFHGLRGVVLWRLGQEDPGWWPAIQGAAGPSR